MFSVGPTCFWTDAVPSGLGAMRFRRDRACYYSKAPNAHSEHTEGSFLIRVVRQPLTPKRLDIIAQPGQVASKGCL